MHIKEHKFTFNGKNDITVHTRLNFRLFSKRLSDRRYIRITKDVVLRNPFTGIFSYWADISTNKSIFGAKIEKDLDRINNNPPNDSSNNNILLFKRW